LNPLPVSKGTPRSPVSHHLAAAKASDALTGQTPPRPASLLRELMHMGQIVQSHGMHFFELAGPDLLLGFDAAPEIRNVVGLIGANPELTVKAVQLRKFGQQVIKTLGGRKIHPVFAVPGGVNKALTIVERDSILEGVEAAIATTQIGLQIIAVFPTGYFGLTTPENGLELYDGNVRLISREGTELERFPIANYLDFIAEHVEPWSYLKFPYYKKLGYPDGVYRVGPLGRLNLAEKIDTPLANDELKIFKSLNNGKPVENTLYYHYARLIEVLFGIERIRALCEDPDILSTDILNTRKDYKGHGVGVIEAPRGTLIHDYTADENGKLLKVNLIVSTGHNNWAMSNAVDSVAKTYVKGPDIHEGMLNRVEAAIRAYDPCLSCSTHAVGQMPIELDIIAPDGSLVKTLKRD
jgi:NAD-reducing hydrogenase large subunit